MSEAAKTTHRYIAVEGPIGAGKTTVAKLLAKEIGALAVLEPAHKNPFLADFYRDRRVYAFKTELFFLLERYKQQLGLKQFDFEHGKVVCDYIFAKDFIFAGINLDEEERRLYNSVYELLDKDLPMPDIVVYLEADPEVLIQRIRKRNFPNEKGLDISYLERLVDAYNNFFFNYSETPLLIVNSNDMDIVENPADWEDLKNAILRHKCGTEHHHYVGKK